MRNFIVVLFVVLVVLFESCENGVSVLPREQGVKQQQSVFVENGVIESRHISPVDSFLTKADYKVVDVMPDKYVIYIRRYLDRHTDAVVIVTYTHSKTEMISLVEGEYTIQGGWIIATIHGKPDILCVYIHGELV